jgi:hypothetical protein
MIKVLSYNIYWKAMTTKTNALSYLPECGPIIKNLLTDGHTKCLANVAKFIEVNAPYDFVGLQEATNWKKIRIITPCLQKMKSFDIETYKGIMVTFYDGTKYSLDPYANNLVGHLEDPYRPFIVLFFQQKICLINLHAGHNSDVYNFDQYLIRTIYDKYLPNASVFLNKLRSYDIIMMGDFNDPLLHNKNNYHQILNRKIYGINKIKSCCDSSMTNNLSNFTQPFDHILSTFSRISSNVYIVPFASDHMPIIAIIEPSNNFDRLLCDLNSVVNNITNISQTDKLVSASKIIEHIILIHGCRITNPEMKILLDELNIYLNTKDEKKYYQHRIHINKLLLQIINQITADLNTYKKN